MELILELDCSQLGQKLIWTSSSSKTLTLDLPLCQERQKEINGFSIFIFRDQNKGNDERVKDFKRGCCGNLIFHRLGVLM